MARRPKGRRPAIFDWILVAAVGAFVIVAGAIGLSSALERSEEPPRTGGPAVFVSGAFGHGGDPSRSGVDPYAPPGLPEGVVIDRESGLMVGLSVEDETDTTYVPWTSIDLDYRQGEDDVPDAIRALDGQRVVMVGFLKAIYAVDDLREFLLVGSHLACCFGTVPGPGGMLLTTLDPDQPSAKMTVEPILVRGTLRIDPVYVRGRRTPVLLYVLEDARVDRLADG